MSSDRTYSTISKKLILVAIVIGALGVSLFFYFTQVTEESARTTPAKKNIVPAPTATTETPAVKPELPIELTVNTTLTDDELNALKTIIQQKTDQQQLNELLALNKSKYSLDLFLA